MPDEDINPPDTADAPQPDVPMTTDEMLRQVLADQRSQRAEVAELRAELAKARTRPPAPSQTALSADELAQQRQDEITAHAFYCPGCGALYNRERECEGRGEAPHPPIEVVSTDEIKGDNANDASKHTAAPGVNP